MPATVVTSPETAPTAFTFEILLATISISEAASFRSLATVSISDTVSAKSFATVITLAIFVATEFTEFMLEATVVTLDATEATVVISPDIGPRLCM